MILLTSVIFVGGMSGWIQTKGAYAATTYGYDPYFTATGSSNYDVSSSTSLRLQKFSVAAWFKTTQTPSEYALIVNKGGFGSESAGKNLNYGIWLSKSGRIQAGFERSSGVNYFVYSPNTYNNGNWHYAVLAYGGYRLSLYIDGQQVAYRDLQVSPDNTGTQALRVGANSYALRNYFVGSIDEVRIYNRSVQPNEVSAMYSGTFSSSGQVLYLPFGTTSSGTSSGTLSAPEGLSGTATSSSVVVLSWKSASSATGYNVYRASSYTGTFTKITSTPVTGTSYTDKGLSASTVYFYRVSSVNSNGQESFKSEITFVPTYKITISQDTVAKKIVAQDFNGKVIASGVLGTDDTKIIQSAVSAIKTAGEGILHIKAGTYVLKARISISYTNYIIIQGDARDSTILRCGYSGIDLLSKLSTSMTKHILIRKLTLDGNNMSDKLINLTGNMYFVTIDNVLFQRSNAIMPGAYLSELHDSTIRNSIFRNPSNSGDAVAISGDRITFKNNEVVRQAARGGGLTSGNLLDSKIINNNFHDFKGYAATSLENFHIAEDGHSFKNVEIAYNTYKNVDGKGINTLGYANGGGGGTYYNLQIHDNYMENVENGININAYSDRPNVLTYNSRIYDNTLLYTGGISAGPLKSSEIDKNTIDHTSGYRGYGIYLYKGTDDVTMDGNKITNAERSAYYYSGSTDIYINGAKVA